MENLEIDALDRQILAKLVEDGKTPYTEIAKQLFVSSGTIHVRMKKMEQMGIVQGATLMLDYFKLGYTLTAFLGVYLEKGSLYNEVALQLKGVPEVVEANYVTGTYNILAKLICRDTNHLNMVLRENIQMINGIQRTETFISLEETIGRRLNFLDTAQLPD